MNTKPITKAVIAAAGFGTRFLPQTKAMPKEMLPLVDKPIIQYIVEELVDAGIQDIVIVTGYHKRSIEDHFDGMSADLRTNLERGGKQDLLKMTDKISDMANFAYIRQKGPYGNATALLNAEHLMGNEPFIYTFADDFVQANPSRFKQLVEVHDQHGGMVLTCIGADQPDDYKRYAFVGGKEVGEGIIAIENIIEKPGSAQNAPSSIASVSGYVVDPPLFDYLHRAKEGLVEGEEFIMQPAIQQMIRDGHPVHGCNVRNGRYYDTGNKLEYLKTVVDFALKHDDISKEFRDYLRSVV